MANTPSSATRYRPLNRTQALLTIALLSLAVGVCLAASRGGAPDTGGDENRNDPALYTRVVERLQRGEAYYDALGAELPSRGYLTSSVFNWRTPLHLETIAHLPSFNYARGLLDAGAVCAVGLASVAVFRTGRFGLAAFQALAMFFTLAMTTFPSAIFFSDVWAGVLIAISIGAYALGWRYTGAAAGVLALFYRELALPYALIGIALAWRERRRPELFLWLAGLFAYAVYFGLHAAAVMSRMPPSAVENSPVDWIRFGWVRFGGVRFLLTTSRMGLLLGVPFWVAALYLPMALLGLFGWVAPVRLRLIATVGVYLLAFSVAGRPDNFYWGAIYSPLLAYGVTWSLPACRDLALAVIPEGLARRWA